MYLLNGPEIPKLESHAPLSRDQSSNILHARARAWGPEISLIKHCQTRGVTPDVPKLWFSFFCYRNFRLYSFAWFFIFQELEFFNNFMLQWHWRWFQLPEEKDIQGKRAQIGFYILLLIFGYETNVFFLGIMLFFSYIFRWEARTLVFLYIS